MVVYVTWGSMYNYTYSQSTTLVIRERSIQKRELDLVKFLV
jgi:hypothetical protein